MNAILNAFVALADENRRALARNKYVFFFVDIDAFLRKDGNIDIIRCFADTQK